jgi:Protein of unknown function (DUF1217)
VLTTLASYRQVSANLERSLATTSRQPMVARETEYYLANIGNVTSVDDFLDDQRLFTYAMKAHGLEDMNYATAFMRKVLESDLNDDASFVNQLTDKRYLQFAKAFHFLPSGSVDVGLTTAQDTASEDAMIGLYSQSRIDKGAAAATEAGYYQTRIGSITSVDQLLADKRLFDFALTAYGIDAGYASESAIRNVLTSDLSDPNSVANQYGEGYLKLAEAFAFATDGSVAPGGSAQTSDQSSLTTLAYYEATRTDESPAAASFKDGYFRQLIGSVSNVDDLVDNEFMRSYVASAAGLDPVFTGPEMVRAMLVSDLSDPASPANENATFRAVAEAFNFNTDGSLNVGVAAQDSEQTETLSNLFFVNYDNDAIETEETKTKYYQSNIGNVLHVDDLLADSLLYDYVLTSFGIDAGEVSKSKIRQVLLADPASTTSQAILQNDIRFKALAAAFNFDTDGNTQGPRVAQSEAGLDSTVARYSATLGELDIDQKLGTAETEYYTQAIATIRSVDELLKDQRLKTYIAKAYGLGNDATDQTLRKVLTSDRLDPSSFVNKSNSATYKALAADFSFNSDGTVARSEVGVAQDKGERITTQELFFRQTLEQTAGEENEGVRLALYFERKAASITSVYGILADKALLQVVKTGLGLPDSISLQDIDKQADLINNRLDIEDFKDPAKLDEFLTRFAALWEIDNPTNAQTVPNLLIGQPLEASVGIDLLTSLQSLRLGGA